VQHSTELKKSCKRDSEEKAAKERRGGVMAIREDKSRVSLTIPTVDLQMFRKDAEDVNLSLSQYVYMVLAANSWNMEEEKGDEFCTRIESLKHRAWQRVR